MNERHLERFWKRVDKNGPIPLYRPDLGPCWIWKGSVNEIGYGKLHIDKKLWRPHRFTWIQENGEIPKPFILDHLCRVRNCVNPMHLDLVTNKENILRGFSTSAMHARQTHCKHGHAFEGDNLRIRANGGRYCAACLTIRSRKRYLALREARAAIQGGDK